MKSKNPKKTKFIFGLTAALSCVALVGTGYSAYVIVASIASINTNVSVTASNVADNRITLAIGTAPSTSYKFGPSNSGSGGLITSSSADVNEEALTASFTFTVSTANTSTLFSSLSSTYTLNLALTSTDSSNADNTSDLEAAVSAEYIVAPTDSTGTSIITISNTGVASALTSNTDNLSVTVSSGGNSTDYTATVTVAVNFTWGKWFNNANPVAYTDADKTKYGTADEQEGASYAGKSLDDVVSALNELYELNGSSFLYTISQAS